MCVCVCVCVCVCACVCPCTPDLGPDGDHSIIVSQGKVLTVIGPTGAAALGHHLALHHRPLVRSPQP